MGSRGRGDFCVRLRAESIVCVAEIEEHPSETAS